MKTESIDADAKDPALASRLNTLGAVQPNPHYSPTSRSQFDPQPQRPSSQASALLGDMMQAPPQSAFPDPRNNPVLRVLEARQRIQDEAEEDLSHVGRRGFAGRKYVDAGLIQLAMMRQARGEPSQRIEEALGIKKGRLGLLRNGTVGPMHEEDA
jgi:3-deoxy-7-phosphoheptulonate synthase